MTSFEWVLFTVVILLLVAVVGLAMALQRRRSARLQDRFGVEYERVVEGAPSRRQAEREMTDIAERRDQLSIRDLTPAAAARWREQWRSVQSRFVDAPAEAVRSADEVLTSIMRERGYPVDDFDERSSLIAVDYPDVVEHYREARIGFQHHRQTGDVDTEELRRAFVHYRALFDSLVGPDPEVATGSPAAPQAASQHAATDPATAADPDRANPYSSDHSLDRPEMPR
jgi:hypothetical protein